MACGFEAKSTGECFSSLRLAPSSTGTSRWCICRHLWVLIQIARGQQDQPGASRTRSLSTCVDGVDLFPIRSQQRLREQRAEAVEHDLKAI